MFIVKILKRKDAVAVIVAVTLGLMLGQFVGSWAINFSSFLSEFINRGPQPGAQPFDWRSGLFDPAILALLQLAVLELVLQITVRGRRLFRYVIYQARRGN